MQETQYRTPRPANMADAVEIALERVGPSMPRSAPKTPPCGTGRSRGRSHEAQMGRGARDASFRISICSSTAWARPPAVREIGKRHQAEKLRAEPPVAHSWDVYVAPERRAPKRRLRAVRAGRSQASATT
jgi:hypothetical protein